MCTVFTRNITALCYGFAVFSCPAYKHKKKTFIKLSFETIKQQSLPVFPPLMRFFFIFVTTSTVEQIRRYLVIIKG